MIGGDYISLSVFLELVEIKAKTASILPFILGIGFSWFNYQTIHPELVVLFFIAMLLFNMAVDILDNYNDYRHATKGHDYQQKVNIIGREHLSLPLVFGMLATMVVIAAGIGIYLVSRVGWPLLWMGIWCFAVGILYSSGPRPLSSLPVGEFFSGITMGFMIVLICVYLNISAFFDWRLATLGRVLLVALPMTLWIANLMLANNICDLEEDEKNRRTTIVHYLGRPRSVVVFMSMNVLAYVALIAAVIVEVAPWFSLVAFVSLPLVIKQMRLFGQRQVKRETFVCAVRILAIGATSQVVTYLIGLAV